MNEQRGRELIESFLGGFSETLDATLSLTLRSDINAIEACGPEMLGVWLGTYPIQAYAGLGRDTGLAFLIETTTALRLLAVLEGKDSLDRQELNDDDRESLSGLLGGAVTQGLSRLLDDCGRPPGLLGEVEVSDRGEAAAMALSTIIGTRFAAAQATLSSGPELAFDAMILYSESMEDWIPSAGGSAPASAALSPDEMNDILRGFGPDSDEHDLSPLAEQHRAPANLDMVLDIRLRATARLGSIEMPLGDVLSFGPGSIIDVGRLVDEPVDLLVNNKLIARGDIVVVDEKYGLRITEIISPRERIESLR